jgi:hypothetical protein
MSEAVSFTARVENWGGWGRILLPKEVLEVLGNRARTPVIGTVAGHPYRKKTLKVENEGGTFIVINKSFRQKADIDFGDELHVELAIDDSPKAEPAS